MSNLRYESFVNCPDILIDSFSYWLGVDLPALSNEYGSAGNVTSFESDADWRERVFSQSSLGHNSNVSNQLGVFSRVDNESGIHGAHISNDGKTGAWKECMSSELQIEIENALAEYLDFFNYSRTSSEPPVRKNVFDVHPAWAKLTHE